MSFINMLTENSFTLVASLPENNLELAKAAIDGGAQAIKVHINVWHRASGHTFGSFSENRPFLESLIGLCGHIPVGLVCGGEDAFISEQELRQLEQIGLGFYSSYVNHLPPFMLRTEGITKMVAINDRYTADIVTGLELLGVDVLEGSIQPGDEYGRPLSTEDLIRYRNLAGLSNLPLLIPTQKIIEPEQVGDLYRVGAKAIMIGAIVMGQEPAADQVRQACEKYRNAIERL
ncbi:MAG: hypothetical protein PHP94_08750 [Eubacteriales bacterium]|nr:hypothetical protein [Eubacteriales bacterium]